MPVSSMNETILALMAARRRRPLIAEDEPPEDKPAAPDFSSGARRPLRRTPSESEQMNRLIYERWRGPTMLGRRM
jgi:hypothetical protein